ncbi:MAG: DUF2243 domain-containing protein [Proteobacteria bacterium]|nr:DUF2243 domain-containing protein [Pseudomonadota bacterium]
MLQAGFVLGFALAGFFDGILLHQVLQWHHLLSLAPGENFRRIEVQILADGAFHVLMWVIALLGLHLLWRARQDFASDRSGGRLVVAALLGFAAWNALDVVGFHWGLHIHRVRVDVPVGDRLRWDLLWLALFSLLPLGAAWLVSRSRRGGSAGRVGPAALALLVTAAAALSLRTPPDAAARPVLFRADLSGAQVLAAVAAANGRLVSTHAGGRLVVVELPEGSSGWRLYRHGALAVGGPGSPAACLSWSRA